MSGDARCEESEKGLPHQGEAAKVRETIDKVEAGMAFVNFL